MRGVISRNDIRDLQESDERQLGRKMIARGLTGLTDQLKEWKKYVCNARHNLVRSALDKLSVLSRRSWNRSWTTLGSAGRACYLN